MSAHSESVGTLLRKEPSAVLELFVPSGSNSFAVTVAVFVTDAFADRGITWTSTVAEAPLRSVPSAHEIVDVPEQTPCVVVTDENVTDAGNVSVRTTPVAVEGPWFVATMRYANIWPTTMGAPSIVLTTDRSAATDVEALEVLFARFGSGVADETVAVFTIGLGAV